MKFVFSFYQNPELKPLLDGDGFRGPEGPLPGLEVRGFHRSTHKGKHG
jgi:hypothetical protein